VSFAGSSDFFSQRIDLCFVLFFLEKIKNTLVRNYVCVTFILARVVLSYYMFRPTWAIFRYHVYKNVKRPLYGILTDPLSLHINTGNISKIVEHW
jgi:hypothetical protein